MFAMEFDGVVGQACERDWLIEFLRDRDVACPLCGYNLRGLYSDRCPECGRGVRLSVLLVEPYLCLWVSIAVGLGASAGIGVFFAVILSQEGWPPSPLIWVRVSLAYFLASIPLFVAVLLGRRGFLRFDRALQRTLAVLSFVLLALGLLMFFAGMG